MSPAGFGRGLLVASHHRLPEGCVLQEGRVGRRVEGAGAIDGAKCQNDAGEELAGCRAVGDKGMSESSLESPGVAISVHLRAPRVVLSNSSKPSVLRVGAACLKLFAVLGIMGSFWVDEVCSRSVFSSPIRTRRETGREGRCCSEEEGGFVR